MNQPASPNKHVVVAGAGLAGLAASYQLVKAGYQVSLFDSASEPGGLASSTTIQGHPVERFYHFICRLDHDLIQLIEELGLADRLHWKNTRTAFYYDQKLYPFGTPFDLIGFRPIPWLQRLRFGFHIIDSRYRSQWKWLDQLPAKPWLIENIGEKAYEVIWHPLLKVKFGDYHDKISAAWVWHRIWRVAKSRKKLWGTEVFGYLEDGSATVIQAMLKWMGSQPNFSLHLGTPIEAVQVENQQVHGIRAGGKTLPCDAFVSTMAMPQLTRILPDLPQPYFDRLKQIQYIGVVCALFVLKKQFSQFFWMNINDPLISFNGVIELTNLNEHWRKAGFHFIYVPYYLETSHPRYHYSDEQLYQEYVEALKLIRPDFSEDWIQEWHIFRSPFAQAICTTNFAELRPDPAAPIAGLYLSDSTQFYPEDRTLSAAIRQGRRVAELICDNHRIV